MVLIMKKRLKNTNEAALYRNELLKKQNGEDPIIKEKIKKPVLDHYHQNHQHCRGVLQNEVNAWEGKVQNSFNRYIKHLTDKPLHEVLRNLADYIEKHSSTPENEMIIHHTALTVDVRKFKSLPANKQIDILKEFGVEPETNSDKRSKQARRLIKDGSLDIKLYIKK